MNTLNDDRSTTTRQPRHVIVGLGEVLWDVFPDGAKFGGAPANFACSVAGLSGDDMQVIVVSSVGDDEFGGRGIAALDEKGVDINYVTRQDRPTGTVHVALNDKGQASYTFASDTAWDHLTWSSELRQLAARVDAVCFGSLGQRSDESRATINAFLEATRPNCLRVFDVNLRPPFFSDEVILTSLQRANVLKLNEDELPVLAALCGMSGTDTEILRQLAARFELLAVALTRGALGAILIRDQEVSDLAGVETTVVDTVGAGDSFTAAFVLGLLGGEELDAIHRHARSVAAYVCSQAGATPAMPSTLRAGPNSEPPRDDA